MRSTRHALYTIGPVPVEDEVRRAASSAMIYHRSDEFRTMLLECEKGLQQIFQTQRRVHVLTASGTGAMECAVVNVLSRGDEVITVNGGKFGARWGAICRAFGLTVHEAIVEWGKTIGVDELSLLLSRHPHVKAIFLTHCETSTGALTDVRSVVAALRHSYDGLVVVDAITSLGIDELRMDAWGIDCVIGGSQKGFRIPPGLAFISLSERAEEAMRRSSLPKFYFDLNASSAALDGGDTPWTPAISLVQALDVSLRTMLAVPVEHRWSRYRWIAASFRGAIETMGLQLHGSPPASALSVVLLPDSIPFNEFKRTMKELYELTFSGGQGELKGRAFRVSHVASFEGDDIPSLLDDIGAGLNTLGFSVATHEALSFFSSSMSAFGAA